MKKILPAFLLILLVSCTKESLNAPGKNVTTLNKTAAVSYKDNSISITDFKAQATANNIEVGFTTLFEKNIVRLEILRGYTSSNLCSIYKQDITSDSYSAVRYSTSDLNENKSSSLYYMVKYTLANGDWGYTPAFKLSF